MVADMRILGRTLLALLVVGYAFTWIGFAILMLFTWEGPKNWIGWLVVIANPATLVALLVTISRYNQRRAEHG
jgi:hypothetical protein